MKRPIYLDYAAATPMDSKVAAAMGPYFSDNFYNPSAAYLAAKAVKKDLAAARSSVSQTLGARPAEIIFTAGATEANNLAIAGIMNQYPQAELLVSAVEHESVLEPAKKFNFKSIPVDNNGIIILNKLSNLISEKSVLISIMLVNNELGTIQPLREVSGLIHKIRLERIAAGNKLPLYIHTDAAQAANYFDLHTSRLGVDLMSLNGGKIYGPKQSGALFLKAGVEIKPLIVGGGQEFNYRSGTENVAGIIGFAKALELAQEARSANAKHVSQLRQTFESKIMAALPEARINGSLKHRAPHITNIILPGLDNERLMMELDERGVICAAGSACSANNQTPSHVLEAIGLDEQQARSSLRFSLGRQSTNKDIVTAASTLCDLTVANR
jgi:cysteine desulfurase